MSRKEYGQSIVEMAFVLPLLVILIFGIIDLGYYVYVYSTLTTAVRDGAEEAAKLPPYPERLAQRGDPDELPDAWKQDRCVMGILNAVERAAGVMGPTTGTQAANLTAIDYPDPTDPKPRALGKKIRVTIANYPIEPLTPLFRFTPLTNDGRFMLTVETERTIEGMGQVPDSKNGIACTRPETP